MRFQFCTLPNLQTSATYSLESHGISGGYTCDNTVNFGPGTEPPLCSAFVFSEKNAVSWDKLGIIGALTVPDTCPALSWMRWNERTLAEAASQENDVQFRKRTGRIDKWKEVTRVAAAENKLKVDLPDKIESLVLQSKVL